ncbi:MAG: hypothetical protein JWM56_280 [Candidatus Peribacteria bacterium]|nr:hypothetical protein [Candidatus Peribacteria bacterium]
MRHYSINRMRTSFLSLFLGMALVACSSAGPWQEFRSNDYGFSIQVPTVPTENSIAVPDSGSGKMIPIHIFTSSTPTGLAYGVTVTDLPSPTSALIPESQLTNALDGLKSTYSGSIIDRKVTTTFSNKPAVRFVLQLSPTKSSRGFLVADGSRIYQITVSGNVSENDNDDRFLNSFKFLK